jgi:hypothetical protein
MLLLGHNFYLEKIPGPTHKMVGALFKEVVYIFLTKFTINLGVSTLQNQSTTGKLRFKGSGCHYNSI